MVNISKESIIDSYRNLAKRYDFIANVYIMVGYRINSYRKESIDSLKLKKGDTVVDLACGTGLNFSYLQKAVGPKGKIIGVDITDAMLEQAKRRIDVHGWKNVELVYCDVEKYKFPNHFDDVLSTFALGYLPNYDGLIKRIYNALPIKGRFAELSFKKPKGKLIRQILLRVFRPFGNVEDSIDRRIWESVERHFDKTIFQEFYFGTTYMVTGEKIGNKS
ncbi:class I SAM-dependent methyltransferase [Candidatus Woesearchaeota archaeon]|nr:class I SAM-dependent methyltransferase [Candidatus Woesearchaeota archaeon]